MSKLHLAVLVALASSLAACSGTDRPNNANAGAKKAQQPDNTARNVRDRDDATRTPMDQGTSEADVAITQSIRKLITDTASLSANAKNVKVITLNGVVTLRGPVGNSEEKTYIESVARSAAGVSRVDNQLEVAGPTTH